MLDIGCATGYLSEKMKEKNCFVVGLEVDKKSAEIAKEKSDELIIGDVEKLDNLPYSEGYFDVIVFGDVLEHLKEPHQVLKRFRKYLAFDGYAVASIPNVAHWSIRFSLLFGKFDYGKYGILDETHLRFYTLTSVKKLFQKAGYKIIKIDGTGKILSILKIWKSLLASQFVVAARRYV